MNRDVTIQVGESIMVFFINLACALLQSVKLPALVSLPVAQRKL
jgi:hypothetical protein